MADPIIVETEFRQTGSANDLAAELSRIFERAFKSISGTLGKEIAGALKNLNTKGLKDAADDADKFAKKIRDAAEAIQDFQKRADAMRRNAGDAFDVNQLSVYNRTLRTLSSSLEEAKDDWQDMGREGRLAFQAISQAGARINFGELGIAQVIQRAMRGAEETRRQAEQNMTRIAVAESKERIVAAQQEGARVVAETRAGSNQRVAVLQAAMGQIRALERGLGTLFSGTARAIGASFSGISKVIGSALSGSRGHLQRFDRELTSGLTTATNRRETILRSSFRQQESILSSSITRQTAQLNRLETAMSSGVLGAATGRSGLANALGIGGLIGAGAGIFSTLRSGLTAGADFTQQLAVLDAQLQLTDEQMQSIRVTALGLGNDLTLPGVSALDAAQAIGLLSKQFGTFGAQAAPLAEQAAKGVLQLSRATQSSAEEAAQVVGAAVNVFGVEASKATQVADQVAGAMSKAAGTSFTDFSAAFKQGATVFAQFQVPALGATDAVLEFNTAIAALATGGLVGSDAGTSLKAFFLQANRGTADANAALDELAQRAGVIGGVFYDAAGQARPLGDTLEIIRQGLVGLSEEERNAKLFTIFGTDAIRAAEILTGMTGPAFDALRDSLRRQGVAAEIAAAQNQGLRGALDALGSTIETQLILAYEKFQVAAGNAVLVAAEFINQLASGEGIFADVRTALKGIGIGLGGLVAVKAVVEGLGLLKVALAGLLTPMGLVIAGVAGIGAAFALLMDHSQAFRDFVAEVREGFAGFGEAFGANDPSQQTGSGFLGFMQNLGIQAREVFNYIGDTLIPKIKEIGLAFGGEVLERARAFGSFFMDSMVPAIGNAVSATVSFVQDTLVPGFVGAFNFIRDEVVPILVDVGKAVADFAVDAAKAVAAFAVANDELVGGVGGALAGFAVGGPLGAGLGAAIGLIATNFEKIRPAVQPAIDAIKDFVDITRDLSLRDALKNLGSGIAESFGNVVDGIVDFGRKIRDAVEEWFNGINWGDVASTVLGGLETVGFAIGRFFSSTGFVTAVAAIAGAVALAVARFGEGLVRGIASNLDNWMRLAFKGLGAALEAAWENPVQALIIGLGVALVAPLAKVFTAAGREAGQGLMSGLRSALTSGGGSVRGFQNPATGLFSALIGGPEGIERQISRSMERAQSVMRTEIQRMRDVLRAVNRDPLRIPTPEIDVSDLERSRQKVTQEYDKLINEIGASGAAGIRLRQAFASIGDAFRNSGVERTIGDRFRSLAIAARDGMAATVDAIKAAGPQIAAAVAGAFAGLTVGRSVAQGGGSLFDQVLAVGGTAAMLGAINPAAGVAAAALGIVGTAFGNMGRQAQEATARTQAYIDALSNLDVTQGISAAVEVFGGQLKQTGEDVADVLDRLNFKARDFITALSEGAEGDYLSDIFGGNLGPEAAEAIELLDAGEVSIEHFIVALKSMDEQAASATFGPQVGAAIGGLKDELDAAEISVDDFISVLRFLETQGASIGVGLEQGADIARILGEEAAGAAPQVDILSASMSALVGAVSGAPTDFRLTQELQDLNNLEFTNEINGVIEGVRDDLDEAAAAADRARQALQDYLSRDYGSSIQGVLDSLTLELPDLQAEFKGNLELPTQELRDAAQRELNESFQDDLLADIQVLITSGELEVADVGQFLNDARTTVQTAMDNGTISVELGMSLLQQIDEIQGDPEFLTKLAAFLETLAPTTPQDFEVPVNVIPVPGANGTGPSGFGGGASSRGLGAAGGQWTAADLGLPENMTVDLPITVNPIVSVGSGSSNLGGLGAALVAAIAAGVTAGAAVVSVALAAATRGALVAAAAVVPSATPIGTSLVAALAAGVVGAIGSVVTSAAAVANAGLTTILASTGAFTAAGTTLTTALASGLAAAISNVVTAAGALANAAITTLAAAVPTVQAVGATTGQAYASGISSMGQTASNAGASLAKSALSGASGGTDAMYSIGVNLGSAIARGIQSTVSAVASAAAKVVSAAISAAQSAAKIKSPSQVFVEIGENMSAGAAIGLANGTPAVAQSAANMSTAAAAAAAGIPVGFVHEDGSAFRIGRTVAEQSQVVAEYAAKLDEYIAAHGDFGTEQMKTNLQAAKDRLEEMQMMENVLNGVAGAMTAAITSGNWTSTELAGVLDTMRNAAAADAEAFKLGQEKLAGLQQLLAEAVKAGDGDEATKLQQIIQTLKAELGALAGKLDQQNSAIKAMADEFAMATAIPNDPLGQAKFLQQFPNTPIEDLYRAAHGIAPGQPISGADLTGWMNNLEDIQSDIAAGLYGQQAKLQQIADAVGVQSEATQTIAETVGTQAEAVTTIVETASVPAAPVETTTAPGDAEILAAMERVLASMETQGQTVTKISTSVDSVASSASAQTTAMTQLNTEVRGLADAARITPDLIRQLAQAFAREVRREDRAA